MGTPVIARWEDLSSVLHAARTQCTVFSPFYSSDGLNLIDSSVRRSVPITIWTRLSLRDWANGVADPEALCSLLARLEQTRRAPNLITNSLLHAKAYFADRARALVGSANLSTGGFDRNVELMVRLDGQDATAALNMLTVASSVRAVNVSTEELASWVSRHRTLVRRARTNLRQSNRALDRAQHEADSSSGHLAIIEPTQALLEEFVDWLAANRDLPGAARLVQLHNDRVVQRQQGHVKQCFSGVFRFLQEHPAWIQRLAAAVRNSDGMIAPDNWLLNDWSAHLRNHANASNDLYSYSTLRAVLPSSRGGTHSSGGGASATLRRIFPLVALFMSQRQQLPIAGPGIQ